MAARIIAVEPFDMVIKAIGEEKQAGLLKKLFPALELDKRGVVVRNPDTGQTNLPKVFTGGDCANGFGAVDCHPIRDHVLRWSLLGSRKHLRQYRLAIALVHVPAGRQRPWFGNDRFARL